MRRGSHNGGIRWHTRWVNVSQTLGGEWIGLPGVDDGEGDVSVGPLCLGRFHERTSASRMRSVAGIGGAANPLSVTYVFRLYYYPCR